MCGISREQGRAGVLKVSYKGQLKVTRLVEEGPITCNKRIRVDSECSSLSLLSPPSLPFSPFSNLPQRELQTHHILKLGCLCMIRHDRKNVQESSSLISGLVHFG